jgi:hypothetical protein
MKTVSVSTEVGDFAEDKDAAAKIRKAVIKPALEAGESITLDFSGVGLATQSFVHALISDPLRSHGESVLSRIEFKGCNKAVKGIIQTVVQYSLESPED